MTDSVERLYERLLVLRSQAGDSAAFAEIVSLYQPQLRYYLRKLLREVHDPESVLQEVWFDVFRALARLNDVGAFRAWLYRIARDRALRELRKRRLSYEVVPPLEHIAADQEIEMRLTEDDAQFLHAALDKLPAAHRDVLVLRYIEDMSYDEIAQVIGCQIGTIRSRLHYAKRALRAELERSDNHERQRTQ